MDAGVVLSGELLAADIAGMLRGRCRVILEDVVLEAVLALAHHSALRALFVACMDFVPMVGEVVAPSEAPVAELALETLSAMYRLDVSVQAPPVRQSPAAGTAHVAPVVGDAGAPEDVLFLQRHAFRHDILRWRYLWIRMCVKPRQTERGNVSHGATKKREISRTSLSINLHF